MHSKKRLLDISLSIILLCAAIPVIVSLALIILVCSGRPVFWSQRRAGLKGRLFRLWKLRTMSNDVNETGCLLPDRDRLTRVGSIIRASSFDELPQLWNVLKGDMSLVGPRPLLPEYLERYTPAQSRRHEVKPGITGWAQVNGRNALSWEQKFELDVWYVDNWSLWLDLKILARTALKVIRRDGVTQAGHVSMSEFKGSAIVSSQSK
ncbi:MAG: sugar transferase [Bryobacteraceae bacterium]